MITLILSVAATVSIGIFVFFAARYLAQAVRIKTISFSIKGALPDVQGAHTGLKERIRNAVSVVAANPASKQAVKIRVIAASIVFLAAFVIIGKMIFALLCGGGFYWAIGWHFNKKIKKMWSVFDEQLIEALGMIKNSVRAGQSLPQALENMVNNSKPPLSLEFAQMLQRSKLGVPVEDALKDMAAKIPSNDLRIMVTAINLSRETGGNMGEILLRLADTMRERKKIQGKIVALTAQGKASGMVMSVVPFILLGLLYAMEPGMMGLLFTTLLGNIMLAIAVTMIAIGTFIINKIVSIDI
ncbi:MAG: hypothetical protein A2219_06245 [Elusimicrobia bacterium RIFOXYA2_FULL_50_26]|nr:MAG: hypothetical protein A2219_06245 [Elusimicrobia bacterium RIFOXYA2_FULL_50_26]